MIVGPSVPPYLTTTRDLRFIFTAAVGVDWQVWDAVHRDGRLKKCDPRALFPRATHRVFKRLGSSELRVYAFTDLPWPQEMRDFDARALVRQLAEAQPLRGEPPAGSEA